MSSVSHTSTKTWELTGPWAGAWKVAAAVGAVGAAGSIAAYAVDTRRFAFSWLFAFITILTIALGSLFFVIVQRLVSASWSVSVRRIAEFLSLGLLPLAALFVPIVVLMPHLFEWLGPAEGGAKHPHVASTHNDEGRSAPAGDAASIEELMKHLPGAPGAPGDKTTASSHGAHGAHGAHGVGAEARTAPGMPSPHELVHEESMTKKAAYLNKPFFLARAVLYFAIWIFCAFRLFGFSRAQDRSADPALTLAAQRFAPLAMPLYALSLTFAAFDWIMSLEPAWFSTIFGVVIFSCGVVSSYCVLILLTLALRRAGLLQGAVTVEHYHDMGKLLFGFLVFWAYVQFSQFMLIWYASLPEETTWFHSRWDHDPWGWISTSLVVVHFVVPFFWLLSRNMKRNLARLESGAAVILAMHVVDIYWFVMPNYLRGQEGFSVHWMDLFTLLCVGGVYFSYVFFQMTRSSLVAVGDPRLERSLHFQNA